MTDPKYAVGDRVRFHGQPAVVKGQGIICPGDSIYHFLGYELIFPDGNFSGWHAEDLLTKEEAE